MSAGRGITHLQWAKRTIEGPGILATCVKGKEKGTVGELYDLFESVKSFVETKIACATDDDH